jgi:hypothetical protein
VSSGTGILALAIFGLSGQDALRGLVAGAGAALAVLLTTAALGVLKPRGITPYGWRRQNERRALRRS